MLWGFLCFSKQINTHISPVICQCHSTPARPKPSRLCWRHFWNSSLVSLARREGAGVATLPAVGTGGRGSGPCGPADLQLDVAAPWLWDPAVRCAGVPSSPDYESPEGRGTSVQVTRRGAHNATGTVDLKGLSDQQGDIAGHTRPTQPRSPTRAVVTRVPRFPAQRVGVGTVPVIKQFWFITACVSISPVASEMTASKPHGGEGACWLKMQIPGLHPGLSSLGTPGVSGVSPPHKPPPPPASPLGSGGLSSCPGFSGSATSGACAGLWRGRTAS